MLFGDYNSRTRDLPDFTENDEFISDLFGTEDLILDETHVFECFKHFNVPLKRNSSDETVNSYGQNLLEFCKFNNIFILNGRLGSDYYLPKLTCKNKRTVDYVLSSPFLFELLEYFSVHDFSSLFSDAHCPVSISLRRAVTANVPPDAASIDLIKPKLWSTDKKKKRLSKTLIFFVSQR